MNFDKFCISLIISCASIILSKITNISSALFCLSIAIVCNFFKISLENTLSESLGEVAVILLMLNLGTHLEIEKINKSKYQLLSICILIMINSFINFVLIKSILDISNKWSVIISFLMVVGSTPISTDLLIKSGEFSTKHGQFALFNLIIQDIVIVLLLSMADANSPALVVIKMAISYIIGIFIRNKSDYINRLLDEFDEVEKIKMVLFPLIVFSMIGYLLNISIEFIFFIFGIALAKINCIKDINKFIEIFNNIVLNLFFINFAQEIRFEALIDVFNLKLFALFVSIKLILFIIVSLLNGFNYLNSLKSAIALLSISDLSLIVLKHFDQRKIILSLACNSMILSPILFKVIQALEPKAKVGIAIKAAKKTVLSLDKYCLIIGYGKLGKELYCNFEEDRIPVIAIDTDINKIGEANKENKKVYLLDSTRTYTYSGLNHLHNCLLVILCIRNFEICRKSLNTIRKSNSKCEVIVACLNRYESNIVQEMGGTPFKIHIESFSEEIYLKVIESIKKIDGSY